MPGVLPHRDAATRGSVCNNISNFSRIKAALPPRDPSNIIPAKATKAQAEPLAGSLPEQRASSTVLSPQSIFPTLDLPLPGAAPGGLLGDEIVYEYGQSVWVRNFRPQDCTWTDWIPGKVVKPTIFHGVAGTRARAYHVATSFADPVQQDYFPCLSEICAADAPCLPHSDVSQCMEN